MFKKLLESLFLIKKDFSLIVKEDTFDFEFSQDENKNIFYKCNKDCFLISVKIDLKNKILQYKIGFTDQKFFHIKNYVFKSLKVNTKEIKSLIYSEILKFEELTNLPKKDLGFFAPIFFNYVNLTNKKYDDFSDVSYQVTCENEYRIISKTLSLNNHILLLIDETYSRISFEAKTIKINPSFPHLFTDHGSYGCNKPSRIPFNDYLFRAIKKNINISCDGHVLATSNYDKETKKMETLISLNLIREKASIVIKEFENNIDVLIKEGKEEISIEGCNNDYKKIAAQINDFLVDLSIRHFLNSETRFKYDIQHSDSLNDDEVNTVKMMLY